MNAAPTHAAVLRRLYLTLFLRGRSSRGLNKDKAPKSVGRKLVSSLLIYSLIGLAALMYLGKDPFILSVHLHGMSMLFLALFVSGSAGEVLFNEQESEILLHRPVKARDLLRAKIRVMVEICLWLALAFNLTGLIIGTFGPNGNLLYLPAHLLTTVMAAVFCTSGIVLAYQLCLKFFGRDRLENLMTATQVLLTITVIAGSQLAPHLIRHLGEMPGLDAAPAWLLALPPAWFAGLDSLLTGEFSSSALLLAAIAIVLTIATPWLSVVRLSGTYQKGLQNLKESQPTTDARTSTGSRLGRIVRLPILSWFLRDPMVAAGFRLTAAYLYRDRDTKLRFYPGLAPVLVMPLIFLVPSVGAGGGGIERGFGIALAGGYLATLPLLALNLLQFSSNWEASDLFRYAPISGPGPLIHGARIAVNLFIALPAIGILGVLSLVLTGSSDSLALLLPGVIAIPLYGHLAGAVGKTIPLFKPSEEARSAGRGIWVMMLMFSSFIISGIAIAAWKLEFFLPYLLVELVVVLLVCRPLGKSIDDSSWPAAE